MKTIEEAAVHELLVNLGYLRAMRDISAMLALRSCGAGTACDVLIGSYVQPDDTTSMILEALDITLSDMKKAGGSSPRQKQYVEILQGKYYEEKTVSELSEQYSLKSKTLYTKLQKAEQTFTLCFFQKITAQKSVENTEKED